MAKKSERAILYFSKNFRRKINLEEVAKISGVSPFHFHRLFVEEHKCTPHAYLENIRMNHATHIMTLFPNWSLTDVAFDSGYSSPGIFSRAFKNYFGVSPSQYRIENVEPSDTTPAANTKQLKVQYLAKQTIQVQKVPLVESKLNVAYQRLIASSPNCKTAFGFYLDAPFHTPPEQCRYFIGTASENGGKNSSVLAIAAGYYTSVSAAGTFDRLEEKMIDLNNQIQKQGYVIDSLVGHEKINLSRDTPFEYMKAQREIFVKIKRE